MSSTRHPLQETPQNREAESPAPKKLKSEPLRVFTFAMSHSPVQVQLLGSHSLFDLVDVICQTTTVGMNESVYDHMWDIFINGISGSFNSSEEFVASADYGADDGGPFRIARRAKLEGLDLVEQTKMALKYDYGSTSLYTITLVKIDEVSNEEASAFPREKLTQMPEKFQEFSIDTVDLNAMFPTFNTFIEQAEMLSVDLFQPGRKHNYGYVERGNEGVKHMIYLPAAPKKELSNYLHLLDYGSQFTYSMFNGSFPCHTWFSMVVFPDGYNKSFGKYGQDVQPGFCDMKVASANPQPDLNTVFPKVAALAGYKKDKKVPKGWITLKDGILRICSGSSKPIQCNAPPGTAFHGKDQHKPDSPEGILFQGKVEIQSLHHLFCFVEGVLRGL
jgi:hypothetical protein